MRRGNRLVTVPMHPGTLSRAVLASMLRQARLGVEEFRRLL